MINRGSQLKGQLIQRAKLINIYTYAGKQVPILTFYQ